MKKSPIIVEPSLLSGDFGKLAEEAKRVEAAGADALHIDVMDGHFVPNLTFGPKVVSAVNRATDLFLDVHLMIYHPFAYIEQFVEAGADRITFHMEATEDVEETLAYIRKCNIQAGLAFRPETSFFAKYLTQCDLILLMTVDPGFGGQAFMPAVLEKILFVREEIEAMQKHHPDVCKDIQVDGGINDITARECFKAGANVFVSGTYLFSLDNMRLGIDKIRGLAQ